MAISNLYSNNDNAYISFLSNNDNVKLTDEEKVKIRRMLAKKDVSLNAQKLIKGIKKYNSLCEQKRRVREDIEAYIRELRENDFPLNYEE